MAYFVYIVRCSDDTLYTGYTTDVEKRVQIHNGEGTASDRAAGARYTRSRRPVALVYTELLKTRSAALKREHEIKQLTRAEKEGLIKANNKL